MTSPGLSEMFAYHAVTMANTIKTSLIVFSRKVSSLQLNLKRDLHWTVCTQSVQVILALPPGITATLRSCPGTATESGE